MVGEKRRERSRDMDQMSNSGPFAVRQPIGRRVALRLVVKIEIAECLPDCVVDDERLRMLFDSLRPREAARGRLRCSPARYQSQLRRSTNGRYFGSGFIT